MYFRASSFIHSLGIRTYDNGIANDYEGSETQFCLGGPHQVVIEMHNANEDELQQSTAHDLHLVCTATGRWEPSSQEIREGFEALTEGRAPNRTESLEEVQREFEQAFEKAGQCRGFSLPWDVLPSSLQGFINEVNAELSQAVRQATDALRWRYGILGPPFPYSSRGGEFSFDAEHWHALPMSLQVHVEVESTGTVHVTPKVKVDTEALLSAKVTESLGHELFREAWAIRRASPRSALVIGVSALEAGFKKFVADLVPDAAWLLETGPTPTLPSMLKNYLPTLPAKNKIEGQVLPPPKKLRSLIDGAIGDRNKVAHTGSAALADETLNERLNAIRDVLWLLDYYRGFEWAFEHIREETKQDLGL